MTPPANGSTSSQSDGEGAAHQDRKPGGKVPGIPASTQMAPRQRWALTLNSTSSSIAAIRFVRRLVVGEALGGLGQERVADFLQRGVDARDSQREVFT
jgi:hypothetical protein